MDSGSNDVRTTAKRWSVAILLVTIAAMGAIRAVSVRHRSPGDGRSLMTGSQSPAALGDGLDAGSAERHKTDPFAMYQYALCAGNLLHIGGQDGAGSLVVGDIQNDARRGGDTRIDGMSDVYGKVTTPGDVAIGSSDAGGPAVLHGAASAETISIGEFGEVRRFEDLNEWVEGVDLDLDGEVADRTVTKSPAAVRAIRSIRSGNTVLATGDTDTRIADATQPVEIRKFAAKIASPPRPDFRLYYEMAAGTSAYPPEEDHVVSEIPGDGEAHYFASAEAFLSWINAQPQTSVLCWRCAGDGQIGPGNSTDCPVCFSTGQTPAVEIAGVFYIDDETLDLSRIETNLVVHGTIVVADGDPHSWPRMPVASDGAAASGRYPRQGSLTIGGAARMNLTITFRSDEERGGYVWRHRTVHSGSDRQTIAVSVAEDGHEMRDFPAVVAASDIAILPRAVGFASNAGEVGDEAMTVIEGVVFAGGEFRAGGRGGWHGDPIVFDEEEIRTEDELLDESVLRIDLNDDGDVFDLLKIADVTGRQVIRVRKGRYTIDINNDGVLGKALIGEDYAEFFSRNGYTAPVLYYQEGIVVADSIRLEGGTAVFFDPLIAGAAPLVGFGGGSAVSAAGGVSASAVRSPGG